MQIDARKDTWLSSVASDHQILSLECFKSNGSGSNAPFWSDIVLAMTAPSASVFCGH